MKGLRAPAELQLTCNVAENWQHCQFSAMFKQRLEVVMTATEPTAKRNDRQKTALLLHVAREEAQSVASQEGGQVSRQAMRGEGGRGREEKESWQATLEQGGGGEGVEGGRKGLPPWVPLTLVMPLGPGDTTAPSSLESKRCTLKS